MLHIISQICSSYCNQKFVPFDQYIPISSPPTPNFGNQPVFFVVLSLPFLDFTHKWSIQYLNFFLQLSDFFPLDLQNIFFLLYSYM